MKKIAGIILASLVAFSLFACTAKPRFLKDSEIKSDVTTVNGSFTIETKTKAYNKKGIEEDITAVVSFELYYDKAPITVNNFYSLSKKYYVDSKERAMIYDFNDSYVAGGDQYLKVTTNKDTGDEVKTPTNKKYNYRIIGEFPKNDWEKNDQKMVAGSLFMVLSGTDKESYDTASSKFAISLTADEKANVAVFGRVTEIKVTKVAGADTEYVYSAEEFFRTADAGSIIDDASKKNNVFIMEFKYDKEYDLGKLLRVKK